MIRRRNIELWLSLFWNIPALFIGLSYGTNLVIALLVFALPALYYSWKKPGLFKRAGIFSLIFIIPTAAITSYLAHADGAWFTPSIFPRVLGVYPVEDVIWGILYTFWIISVYEYFFEKERHYVFPRQFRVLSIVLFSLAAIFSFSMYLYPRAGIIPYFYAIFTGMLFMLVPWIFFARHQALISKVIQLEMFFLLPSFLLEYIAYVNHNWWFPGHDFVGYVTTLGITIPLEEFVWLLIAVPAWIAYYELFADDGR